jgi:membrane protein
MGLFRDIAEFIKQGVWQKDEKDFSSGRVWRAVRQFRVVLFTARGFNRHDTAVRSAALSFYTVMSIVPILALIFAIFKGFGMEEYFNTYLYELFPSYKAALDVVIGFIENLLARTRGGIMAVGAFVVLLWAVVQVFSNVESAFNNIWEVKKSRSMTRRFTSYMAVMILVPILLLMANGIFVGMRTSMEIFTGSLFTKIVMSLLSVTIIIIMFTLIYFLLPNTEVKFRNALVSGVVAGVGFSIFQVVYVLIQGNLTSYNAIYGTFAAIPLFLMWLQISWQILLFGGELSFANQNIRNYEQERLSLKVSYDVRCKIMIACMVIIIRDYLSEKTLATAEGISEELNLPLRIVRDVVYELEDAGLILFVKNEEREKEDALAPARDAHSIRFFDVISSVTGHGATIVNEGDTPLMMRVGATYDKVKGDVGGSADNIYLTDLL